MSNINLYEEKLAKIIISFDRQLFLLRQISRDKLTGRALEVWILIASALSTGSSIIILGKDSKYFFAETIMLARSFLEKIVNFCYLQVCSNSEYEKFMLHPYYRQYHNLNRTKNAHDEKIILQYSGIDEFTKIPQVKKSLEKFSDTNSRKNWSKKTIDEKVAYIKNYSNIDVSFFLMSLLTIYSDASESLHGSLYGCSYHTRVYEPSINQHNKDEVAIYNLKTLILLYANMATLTHLIFQLLKQQNNKIGALFDESKKNQHEILETLNQVFKKKDIG